MNILDKLLKEAEGQRTVALAYAEAFATFAKGYEHLNKAILVAAQVEGVGATVEAEIEQYEELLKKPQAKAEKTTVIQKEEKPAPKVEPKAEKEEAPEEEVEKPKRTVTKTAEKLPKVTEISKAVSSVFVNLPKPVLDWATLEMDKLFDSYDLVTAKDIVGKPESVDFLFKVNQISEQAQQRAKDTETFEEIKGMSIDEFKNIVMEYSKSEDPAKQKGLLAAKEKFDVAKASQVAEKDYAAFVEVMKSAGAEDDEF